MSATRDAHDMKNAMTALRLQVEIQAEVQGEEAMRDILRMVDRVEQAFERFIAPPPEG